MNKNESLFAEQCKACWTSTAWSALGREGQTEALVPNWSYIRANDRRAARSAKWPYKEPGIGSAQQMCRTGTFSSLRTIYSGPNTEERSQRLPWKLKNVLLLLSIQINRISEDFPVLENKLNFAHASSTLEMYLWLWFGCLSPPKDNHSKEVSPGCMEFGLHANHILVYKK